MVRIDYKNMELFSFLQALLMISREVAEKRIKTSIQDKKTIANFVKHCLKSIEAQTSNFLAFKLMIETIVKNLGTD